MSQATFTKNLGSQWNFLLIIGILISLTLPSCNCKKTDQYFVTDPKGYDVLFKICVKKATAKEKLAIAILRQLSNFCIKINTYIDYSSSISAIPLKEYENILETKNSTEILVLELKEVKDDFTWGNTIYDAYIDFFKECDVRFFENSDMKILSEIAFLNKTSEIIGPYKEVLDASKDLELATKKVENSMPSLAMMYKEKNYQLSENQRKLLKEIIVDMPELSSKIKIKYPNTTGAQEHIQLISNFFIQSLMLQK